MLSQIKLLLGITDTTKDTLLNLMIKIASDLALRTINPFEDDIDSLVLPYKYDLWVVQAVQQMYNNLGSESIKAYSENGLSITYQDFVSGISSSLLGQLIPKAKALW
jgi:plasmid maintenance system antidote protein VapI